MIYEAIQRDVNVARQKIIDKSIPVTESGCWIWTAGVSGGYGYMMLPGMNNNAAAHRISFMAFRGVRQSTGTHIHHKCNTPLCVNPDHLQEVSPQFNTLACSNAPATINAQKTHCDHGHELAGDNLYLYRGNRMCRACRYRHTMKYYSTRTTVAARGRKPKCR